MTNLEQQLLSAFDELSTQFDQQHQASQQAQSELLRMFETTSAENENLKRQVNELSEQVAILAKLLRSKNR